MKYVKFFSLVLLVIFSTLGASSVIESIIGQSGWELDSQNVENVISEPVIAGDEVKSAVLNAKFQALSIKIDILECTNQGGTYDVATQNCNTNQNLYNGYELKCVSRCLSYIGRTEPLTLDEYMTNFQPDNFSTVSASRTNASAGTGVPLDGIIGSYYEDTVLFTNVNFNRFQNVIFDQGGTPYTAPGDSSSSIHYCTMSIAGVLESNGNPLESANYSVLKDGLPVSNATDCADFSQNILGTQNTLDLSPDFIYY